MQLHDAEQLAKRLMQQFGLGHWIFRWSGATRTFGTCSHSLRTISLSADLTSRNEQSEVEDCIRHEIAHALAPEDAGHDGRWKRMCAVTGARPERCYDSAEVDQKKGDWIATCGACGRTYTKFKHNVRRDRQQFCADKECKRRLGQRCHPLARLIFHHKNFNPTHYAKNVLGIAEVKGFAPKGVTQQYRTAVEAMKEQLRKQEEIQRMKDRIAELERKLGK